MQKYMGLSRNSSARNMDTFKTIGYPSEANKSSKAGILNSKTTLAEENLRDFQLNQVKKESGAHKKIFSPQRIQLPAYFNTPRRVEDGLVRNKISSHKTIIQSLLKNNSGLSMSYKDSYNRIMANKRLKDYHMLAFACKRAGKHRDEGRAYYSEGVLCDNLSKYKQAIGYYKKFLEVCKAIGDNHGEALAYNCIGVDYQKMAEEDPSLYKKAIDMHLKHKEIADTSGKFISHVNLGIIYNQLGDQEKSNINHHFALRYAVQMSSIPGQKVALGNLGKIGTYSFSSNPEKLLKFVENYIELSEKDQEKDPNAYLRLGQLLSTKGKYDESSKQFFKAISAAEKEGEKTIKNEAVINFGMATANATWKDKCKQITEQYKTHAYNEDQGEDEEEYIDVKNKLEVELQKLNADNALEGHDNSVSIIQK
ncbi:unnamed protein product [Moneuplotes crassus]|uniref:Tetratricopeptide repeat protein 29 n=1 Tax=Euplotes crassus TaxID=5936 RepID=A0AAD1XEW2_EUPCR|nr:unnamed protein product [Moneuplotes crassus]